jgi:starch synthase (maltosyl-transferring)
MAEKRRRAAGDANAAKPAQNVTDPTGLPPEGRVRAIVEGLRPLVDGGRFAAKRIAGEPVQIEAHCFADGHDRVRAVLRWASQSERREYEVEMTARPNDVWTAEFTPPLPGLYRCAVTAWVDHFESWRHDLRRREDRKDIRMALLVGAGLIESAAARAGDPDREPLSAWAASLRSLAATEAADSDAMQALALDPARAAMAARHADRRFAATAVLEIFADRRRARYSSWYELFPRSASGEFGRHGTFRDVAERLDYVARMGFDVLYLPPIHPIGRINRKGTNNALRAGGGDVGSPWAIGSAEGGHKDILPELGNLEDFKALLRQAKLLEIEIAMDIAFQCAPDHPYVHEHPDWFRRRPDGSVQYAENPPKKYQDIYPFDFECDDWRGLWAELKSVLDFWIEQGVRIFRVDNPHTKSFAFWEWAIGAIKRARPEVIFLAEAFTRPKVMHRLAKLGFTQSYTYFTWRTSKSELTEYFTEMSRGPGRDFFRPNVWANTPDILPEQLQSGLRPVYAARIVLAATLSANFGIYGPTYELMESTPREPGTEEYLDSEKYQLRHWSIDRPDSLWPLAARINRIRRDNPALQSDASLRFWPVDNDQLIAYSKHDPASGNVVLTVVNLDPYNTQSGWLDLDLRGFDVAADQRYQMHDLLSDQRFEWRGARNFVMLDPGRMPAHVLRLRRHDRREHDFDYFL